MALFLQQVLNGLMIGSTYAVVALGFSLVFSVMRVVNMAHPEFFMAGAFGAYLTITHVTRNVLGVLEDRYGEASPAGKGGVTVTLHTTSSSTGTFLDASGNPLSHSSITIPQGAATATFFPVMTLAVRVREKETSGVLFPVGPDPISWTG